jgi:hypothetical protein
LFKRQKVEAIAMRSMTACVLKMTNQAQPPLAQLPLMTPR